LPVRLYRADDDVVSTRRRSAPTSERARGAEIDTRANCGKNAEILQKSAALSRDHLPAARTPPTSALARYLR